MAILEEFSENVAIMASIGSKNYNLDKDGFSDEDKLVFLYPTKIDLLKTNKIHYHTTKFKDGVRYDYNVRDIRKLIGLVFEGDPMALEAFQNVEVLDGDLSHIFNELANYEIDPYHLYHGLKGLAYNHYKYLMSSDKKDLKEDSSVIKYVDTYGYNTKALYQIYRMNTMLERYQKGIKQKDLLNFTEDEAQKLMEIKTNSDSELFKGNRFTKLEAQALGGEVLKSIDRKKEYFQSIAYDIKKQDEDRRVFEEELAQILFKNYQY